MPTDPPTVVVFRKWKDDGDIIALLPEIPWDTIGNTCASYMRVGEHSAAHPEIVNNLTVPATPTEYAPLLDCLRRRGYDNLQIRQRVTAAATRRRIQTARFIA